jgi:uncharacterized protein
MDIISGIKADLAATARGDVDVIWTLRDLLAAFNRAKKVGSRVVKLTDNEILEVLDIEAQKYRDVLSRAIRDGKRQEACGTQKKLSMVEKYLPPPLTEAEVCDIIKLAVEKWGATSLLYLDNVMKDILPQTRGKFSGKKVEELTREALIS